MAAELVFVVTVVLLAFAGAFVALGPGPGGRRRGHRAVVPSASGLLPLAEGVLDVLDGCGPLLRARLQAGRARTRVGCLREMPAMLDVVTLGLLSGLSFDASLELYCQRYDGLLADRLSSALTSWRMGVTSREAALRSVADYLGVDALRSFAQTVAQALAFGSPLAKALEGQAQTIRDEQRSQVEEEIERVPVKMLVPLGTLIVPAMLLAILGPLLGPSLALGH